MFNYLNRLRLLSVLFFVLFLILTARLVHLQILQHDFYVDKADRQYQRQVTTVNDRGSIFFSRKDGQLVSAATMKQGFLVAINPLRLSQPETVYEQLKTYLPALKLEEFLVKANKHNDPYEEIAPQVDEEVAQQILALDLEGVMAYKTRWRVYPANSLAAHVIGFIGYDEAGEKMVGRYGLEREYEAMLLRQADKSFVAFLAEVLSEIKNVAIGQNAPAEEANLVLTIEPQVTQTLESELAQVKEHYQAEAAGGIIMDPYTGEIVAMSALPNFDPGGKIDDVAVLSNPLVENVYEMGSIMKPLTMAAALDAGVVTPATTYNDTGVIELDGRRIANYDGVARGVVNMQEVLNQSLNTGAVFAMQKLGQERFLNYFTSYGFADKTGIDLPGEVGGLTKNLASPRAVEYATASFGQGIAMSPISITRALASLANGGQLVRPHVVKRFEWRTLQATKDVAPEIQRQVLQATTSQTITKMLVEVVDTKLANGTAKQEHYSVAAKTGTAQMAKPGGGYYDDRYLHSFFGYFPASQPRFLIFMYLLEPQGVRYSSETLTDPFVNLTKFLINYYQLTPDR